MNDWRWHTGGSSVPFRTPPPTARARGFGSKAGRGLFPSSGGILEVPVHTVPEWGAEGVIRYPLHRRAEGGKHRDSCVRDPFEEAGLQAQWQNRCSPLAWGWGGSREGPLEV